MTCVLPNTDTGDDWAAKMQLVAPYGEWLPAAADTETWVASGLATGLADLCSWWATYSDQYPLTVAETYGGSGGAATITDTFTFEAFRATGTDRYAPIPPMLALAHAYSFPVTFGGTVTDTRLLTSWGPCKAVVNADSWTATFSSDLASYIDSRATLDPTGANATLLAELGTAVDAITTAGHLAPWVRPTYEDTEERTYPHWSEPGAGLLHMARYYDLLSTARQAAVVTWLDTEHTNYPPESDATTGLCDRGAARTLCPGQHLLVV